MKEKNFKLLQLLPLVFLILGALAGFIYYYYIGCKTGSCPIKSSPCLMTAYGAFTGFLTGELLRPSKKKEREKKCED